MDISIVIVNYNTCKMLDECITSIKQETRARFEIIVVDNASRDDSIDMIKAKHPDVILIQNQGNNGFAHGNNQGFKEANGRYYFMLNPDTLILDRAIDKLFEYMEQSSDAAIASPMNLDEKRGLQYNCDFFPSLWIMFVEYLRLHILFPKVKLFNRGRIRYWDYADTRHVDSAMGCSLLIRSNVFNELNGLDDKFFMYFEETDFCYRAYKKGYKTFFYSESKIIHYGGQSAKTTEKAMMGTMVSSYYLESKYYFFRKNYGITKMLCARMLDGVYGIFLWLKNVRRKDSRLKLDRQKKAAMFVRSAFHFK
ncbi:MAG: glycosyltransferase family 2 protein [Desulfobacula sp.]|uniref:glycosyltransferase family 2 protein n=1 Tax=Desulfobacula sp. TaxID=2593537 RepID=UPI0025BDA646|nr:glycosyltransferase family 2 protein [Desulfobacula sp.]MCD4722094.1 glycosyltransferase family 2 protein [Desulfobacula sp.]